MYVLLRTWIPFSIPSNDSLLLDETLQEQVLLLELVENLIRRLLVLVLHESTIIRFHPPFQSNESIPLPSCSVDMGTYNRAHASSPPILGSQLEGAFRRFCSYRRNKLHWC